MKSKSKKTGLRPTTGKAREALFDILRGKIANARFLDLYAGTGAVGINALREGASEVVFVERSMKNIKKMNDSVAKLHLENKCSIISRKVLSFIEHAELENQTFDIIFLDPPYHTDDMDHAMSAIGTASILEKDGLVIAEHFKKKQLPDHCRNLKKIKEYNYGDTVFTFFKKSEIQEQ